MSLQDPISDMLTHIRNGQARKKWEVKMPSSKLKVAVAGILKEEGYITDFNISTDEIKKVLSVELKYFEGKPVIATLDRVSRPSVRRYRGTGDLPTILNGLGIAIISTPQGVMTDKTARAQGVGGEVLCTVS
jgi:small subunit ribosomal protein S8